MKSQSMRLISALIFATILAAGCNSGGSSSSGATAASSAKAITAFSFASLSVSGTIDETTHTIAVTVPFGTNVTALVATFTTTGKRVTVNSTLQTNGVTPNNFTNPVIYTVTAADGTNQAYTVTVTVNSFSTKSFLSFVVNGVYGTINESAKTIAIVLPPDVTDITALTPLFTVSAGATVRVGATPQTSGVTSNNFTDPIIYTVVASDTTTATYTVSVTLLSAPNLMSAFSISSPSAAGVINQTAKTVSVVIPYEPSGQHRDALTAVYTVSAGAIVKIGSVVQASGITTNDFSSAVVYKVIASDGESVNYTVTVTYLPAVFSLYSFETISAQGTISTNAIAVTVPARTDVTNLISTFTVTNTQSVTVSGAAQTSGVTAQDFSSPIIYTLMDGAGATKTYTAVVTIASGTLNLQKTGQATSYCSASTSDDGTLQKGVPFLSTRFSVNSSMVSDSLSGLTWPVDGSTPTAVGCTGGVMAWQDALDYISCLNSNSYLGMTDWRMPNANELASLLTASVPNVSSWLNSLLLFSNMQGNFYFTSTSHPSDATKARIINMVTGNSVFGSKTDLLNVIPVRGTSDGRAPVPVTGQTTSSSTGDDGDVQAGIAWPATRFTSLGSGTMMQDNLTGLIWTADGNTPNSLVCSMDGTWQGALNYIACLNTTGYLGYTDWRLPNINELMSLIHAGQADTAAWLNTQGFSNVQGNFYWSSTTNASDTARAWGVFMQVGNKDTNIKTNDAGDNLKAWPVRGGY
ncbi:MAG TPA: DUF1566 domain-containing protein [Nitrospirota bacterium]|nr:DUF1566 domain-containing protein [Nitrospirota bacterium]